MDTMNAQERHDHLEMFGSVLLWEYRIYTDQLRQAMNAHYFAEFLEHIKHDKCTLKHWYKENWVITTPQELRKAAAEWDEKRGDV